jgi:hypothetical protein
MMMFLSLWILLLPLSSRIMRSVGSALIERQNELPECRLEYQTDVWTGCYDVVAQFSLSLERFLEANPQLTEECGGFVPGETYCIHRCEWCSVGSSVQFPRTQLNLLNSQRETSSSQLHHRWHLRPSDKLQPDLRWKRLWRLLWKRRIVGSSVDYCGVGNCQEGSCDGGGPYSTDGRCGRDFSYLPCPPKFGLCCSQHGLYATLCFP